MATTAKRKNRKPSCNPANAADTTQSTLAAIVESSDDAILSKNLDGIITSWNAGATRLFGYAPAEIIGKSILTLIPPELRHEEKDILRQLRAGKRIDHYETVRVSKNGKRVDVSLTISPVKNSAGEVIGASKIVRDISERKRAEAILSMLAAIVENSDDAIISKDLNGIITSWNAAATRLFGYTPEEAIGQPVLMIIPPDLHHEEVEILRKLRAGERIDHYESVRLTKSQKRLQVSLTISPLRNSRGEVVGVSKIARDITLRKNAEQALIQSEKLAAIGRMLATIAHEINNPLESVTNLAYLLAQADHLAATERHWATILLQEVVRMGRISKQVLAFYREDSTPTPIQITELLDALLELHRQTADKKRIRIVREYHQVPTVFGFDGELKQVFSNLLIHSLETATEYGNLMVRVTEWGSPPKGAGPAVRITIADNGPGILNENRGKIFDPFFTNSAKGTGLGLWVSKAILEKHGGSIRMRSRTGAEKSGTVFSVMLPCNLTARSMLRDALTMRSDTPTM